MDDDDVRTKEKKRDSPPLEIRVFVFSHARVRPLTYRE
jgi:hypothetical protein